MSFQTRARYFVAGLVVGVLLLSVGLGRAKGEFKQVPHWWVAKALCVHDGYVHAARPPFRRLYDVSGAGEGSWRDPDPPYYGGMQMNLGFQRHYGGWMVEHFGGSLGGGGVLPNAETPSERCPAPAS